MNELLFYRDLGRGGGNRPFLLMIHGDFSDGPGTWERQMTSPTLQDVFRLIVVDRRGAGKSPVFPRPYTIPQEASDCLAVLDALGIERCHIAGHSYGGLIAWELACLAPERVQSLHLIEAPYLALLPDDPDVVALRDATARVSRHAATWPAHRIAEAFFAALMGEEAVRRIKEKPVWTHLVREAQRYGYQQLPASYPLQRLKDLKDRLLSKKAAAPPVVLYTGGRSHPALQNVTRRLHTLVEGARLVFVPEAGHSVQHAGDTLERMLLACAQGD